MTVIKVYTTTTLFIRSIIKRKLFFKWFNGRLAFKLTATVIVRQTSAPPKAVDRRACGARLFDQPQTAVRHSHMERRIHD